MSAIESVERGSMRQHTAWRCIYILLYISVTRSAQAGRLYDERAGHSRGDGWSLRRLQRRFTLEDLQPIPARGTCRLAWYTPTPPKFGNTVLCNGSSPDDCLEPCMAGFAKLQNSSVCLQTCPAETAGPSSACPMSRTCVRSEAVCPMLADVPYLCPVPDQFLGSCAKQQYQAVISNHKTEQPCKGILIKQHTGRWRCSEGPVHEPCDPGFTNTTNTSTAGLGTRCTQACPPWLVDCGETCHMPGVPCSVASETLCPVVPLDACSLSDRSSLALQTACQHEGFRGINGCPLALSMHGSCGGARLQVRSGLRKGGFLRQVEAWWGPVVGQEPLPDNYDGPLRAIRLTFSDQKEAVVFGNASLALSSSPRMTFKMDPNELVVGTNMWSSSSVMDGTHLTPLLAGFSIYTSSKSSWTAGGMTNWDGKLGSKQIGQALSSWSQHMPLSGKEVGVGLPVGAAAYTSDSGIHLFGLIYLSRVAKQEL